MSARLDEFKLHSGQFEVFHDTRRFIVTVAGRRWGKTHLASVKQLTKSLQTKHRGYDVTKFETWYIAPTFGQAKDIYWTPLKRLAEPYTHKVWEVDGRIELKNGRMMQIKGSDNPDRLRGVGLSLALFDEYASMKPQTWEVIVRPMLSDVKGDAFFIGTPEGKNHFYQLWLEAQTRENWAAYHFMTKENPFIDRQEIADAKRDMARDVYRQEYEASFDRGTGTIFPDAEPIILKEAPVDEGEIFMTVDLAGFGSEKKEKGSRLARLDEHAINVVHVGPKGWTVIDIISGRWDVREAAIRILATARTYQPIGLGIEAGSLANAVEPYLLEQQHRFGVFLPIIPIRHVGNMRNKQSRITWALQGRLEKGTLRFVEGEYIEKVMDQLSDFPNGQHDDLIDALSMTDFISNYIAPHEVIEDTWEPLEAGVGY